MATFVLTLETPARQRPKGRDADIAERAAIQQALLIVVSQVSNNAAYSGALSLPGAEGGFSYSVEGE